MSTFSVLKGILYNCLVYIVFSVKRKDNRKEYIIFRLPSCADILSVWTCAVGVSLFGPHWSTSCFMLTLCDRFTLVHHLYGCYDFCFCILISGFKLDICFFSA